MSVPSLNVYQNGFGQVSGDQYNTFLQGAVTAANLRSFIGLSGMTVFMQGYTTANDGGQGIFYWNVSGTGPDDNGVTAIVPNGSASGCWTRLSITQGIISPALLPFVTAETLSAASGILGSFIPSTYPLQGGMFALNNGLPQLAFLNTNSIWNADMLGITSNDPVTQGGTATIGGTITAGNTVTLTFAWGANSIPITYTVASLDTTLTIAANLTALIKLNATINSVFWVNYNPGGSIIQIQPYSTITPTVTGSVSGGATVTITVSAFTTALDDEPIIMVNHYVPGRADQTGDAVGSIQFGTLSAPDQLGGTGVQYASILAIIGSASTPLGILYLNTVDSGGILARFLIQRGMVGFTLAQVQATGGDQGSGTINLPGGYFLQGRDIRTVTNTSIAAATGATLTAAQMYNGIINRTTQAVATDTTDTATNILATIPNPSLGVSYPLLLINDMAGTWTINAGSGVTLGTSTGTLAIATGVAGRRVTVQVTNIGTPAITIWG